MNIINNNNLSIIIITYILISLLIYNLKPDIMFDKNGTMKQFGVGKNKTVIYFPFVLIVLAIIIFLIINICRNKTE